MTRPSFNMVRTAVLLIAGLAGVAHETLVNNGDRPTLLLLFGSMIGLPAFISSDKKRTENADK